VNWDDAVEDVLAGDMTACLSYVTPAGGAVVTPVATIGLHDRQLGTVSFTTSLAFGKKLERLRRNPRVALSYHAREHGYATSPGVVLVQGTAAVDLHPDRSVLEGLVPAAERFLGPVKTGRLFWDRWLQQYYQDRVVVTVTVLRVIAWPDAAAGGTPSVFGKPVAEAPQPQSPPKGGTASRTDAVKAAQRLRKLHHHLLGYVDGDGFPMVVPVVVEPPSGQAGVALSAAAHLPEGGRRAGLLGHSYRPKLIGLTLRQHTGWMDVGAAEGTAAYAPHTDKGFRAPPNKTLLLLANGFLAKQALRKAARVTPPG
jgi:hypothetical protein